MVHLFFKEPAPEKVIAMFNIEMIGTESKWGRNSAYITGFDKSDMGQMLQENLKGTVFNFYPDPYPDQNLFYRSDNATLASLEFLRIPFPHQQMDSENFTILLTTNLKRLTWII
jgi:Zn-dependent M28 family amino/carboxypeptidase